MWKLVQEIAIKECSRALCDQYHAQIGRSVLGFADSVSRPSGSASKTEGKN